jgi:protein arginine kinase
MTNLPTELLEQKLWQEGSIWLGSSLTLQRNLAAGKFPPKLNPADMETVCSSLGEVLQKMLPSSCSLAAEEVLPLDKEFLFEHFLCPESFQHTSHGQRFIIAPKLNTLALINYKNHLQLHLFDPTQNLLATWQNLSNLDQEVEKKLSYAFSPKFGYLTSDPSQAGTALNIATFLHVPALIHTQRLHHVLADQKEESVIGSGLEGTLDDCVGDFIVLKNRYTLGVSEDEIVHALLFASTQLAAQEKAARAQLKGNPAIQDLVLRAYGLVRHAYQLETKETLNALSLLKLGSELGWVKPVSPTLFFDCRRAHLSHLLKETNLDPQTLARKRAEFIQGALKE